MLSDGGLGQHVSIGGIASAQKEGGRPNRKPGGTKTIKTAEKQPQIRKGKSGEAVLLGARRVVLGGHEGIGSLKDVSSCGEPCINQERKKEMNSKTSGDGL